MGPLPSIVHHVDDEGALTHVLRYPPSSINVPTVRLKSSACSGWAMEAPKVNYKCAVCGSYLEDSPNRTGIYCTHCGVASSSNSGAARMDPGSDWKPSELIDQGFIARRHGLNPWQAG